MHDYNQGKHRSENHSRYEHWKKNLPEEGYRAMCNWDHFSKLVREPETRKVENDGCISIDGTKYQLSSKFAGKIVTLLWGLIDKELFVSYDNQNHGPFYPTSGPIPFGNYYKFKKTSQERRINKIEHLSKVISISKESLKSENNHTKELIDRANLNKYTEKFIPFEKPDPFENNRFRNIIEAKSTISSWIGYPLCRLDKEIIDKIDYIVSESLDKKFVMSEVKKLFKTKFEVKQ